MEIKKVKCRACAREFDEDKITMLNDKKYICHNCLINIVNGIKSEMFLTTGEQKQYIMMDSDNVEALDNMLIELEEYYTLLARQSQKTSELIKKIRKQMNYFKLDEK